MKVIYAAALAVCTTAGGCAKTLRPSSLPGAASVPHRANVGPASRPASASKPAPQQLGLSCAFEGLADGPSIMVFFVGGPQSEVASIRQEIDIDGTLTASTELSGLESTPSQPWPLATHRGNLADQPFEMTIDAVASPQTEFRHYTGWASAPGEPASSSASESPRAPIVCYRFQRP